jgi:tetratricopeptide (TPR) repeat protein
VQPLGYHVVNVIVHALNAVLLWLVLRRLCVPAAWMAAGVFALHPMQVESVAWVTERKNVLSGLFALSAALVYLEWVAPGDDARGARIQWRPYLATCALFVCALWSKTVTCSLPAVLLLIAWWQHGTIDRRTVWRLAPLFVMGVVMASVTIWMEQHHVGAEGDEWALSLVERSLIAGRALWFYPRTLLWPRNLTFVYPRWSIDSHVWWQYLFPVTAVAVIVVLFAARRRLGRGPLVATLCYAGALLPALGFVNVFPMRFSFVADHFSYLPIIGLIVLATTGGAELLRRGGPIDRRLGYAVCASILLALAVLTARQCGIYRNLRVLWTDTLAKNPACWMAHHNLGAVLLGQGGHLEEAIGHFEEALRLKPDFPDAHYNLGTALVQARQLEAGIEQFQQAVHLKPDYAVAYNNLGGVLFETGRSQEAIDQYERALQLDPDFPEAHNNLGTVLTQAGQPQAAIEHFEQALRLKPDYPEAHWGLGNALVRTRRLQEAIGHFEQALRLNPDYADAHTSLAGVLFQTGRPEEAIEHFQQALRLRPDDDDFRHNLEKALAEQRKAAEEFHRENVN